MPVIATEPVYAEDANGIMRLIAAPGDVVPDPAVARAYGIVTLPDDPAAAVPPLSDYDELSEAAILAALPGLPAAQQQLVRAYEQAHLARGTITTWGLRSTVVRGARNPNPAPMTVPAESAAIRDGYPGMDDAALDAELALRGLSVRSNAGKAAKVKVLQDDDAKRAKGE